MNMKVDDTPPNLSIAEEDTHISLTNEEKQRIYMPWKFSVIIKVLGKKLNRAYLKRKLATMWRLSEEITLIDLGHKYYIIKLLKEENTQKILQEGPWFVKWILPLRQRLATKLCAIRSNGK